MKPRSVEGVEKGCIIISLKITRAAVNEKGAVHIRVLKKKKKKAAGHDPKHFCFLSILYIVLIV